MKSLEPNEKLQNLIKEIEVTKKNQVEIIELKVQPPKNQKTTTKVLIGWVQW